jgi:hypothetical protein
MQSKFMQRINEIMKPRFRVNFYGGQPYLVPCNSTAERMYNDNASFEFKARNRALEMSRAIEEMAKIINS